MCLWRFYVHFTFYRGIIISIIKFVGLGRERERERNRQRKKKIRRNNNTSTILRDDWWISRMLYSLWVIIYGTYILKNISVLCYDVTSKKCSIEIFVGLYVYTGWLIHKNEWKKTSNTNKSSMCFVWCFCCCCFCSYYCCCPLLLVLFYIFFFSVYFQLSCKFSFSFLVKNSICFFFRSLAFSLCSFCVCIIAGRSH